MINASGMTLAEYLFAEFIKNKLNPTNEEILLAKDEAFLLVRKFKYLEKEIE